LVYIYIILEPQENKLALKAKKMGYIKNNKQLQKSKQGAKGIGLWAIMNILEGYGHWSRQNGSANSILENQISKLKTNH